ncbi:MFS transporter [Candidatus Woesearchaeota archaeon]|nr:MFS transporter [Candidatus Woesearchaeota archaeon]
MLNKKEKILLYSNNLWLLGEGMFGPLLAVFTEKIGGSVLDISSAWATYLITLGILVIVIGKLSDKKGRKEKFMIAGFALNAIFTFGYLFVSSTSHLFIIQAGLGLAAALAIPTWNSLYAKYEDKKHDGFTWGLASGESSITTGIAIIIGGFIVTTLSFEALFLIMGSIQILATLYQARILRKL